MEYTRVLELCGNYGHYQVVLLLCLAYSTILAAFHYFSQTIISFTPSHWCKHEELLNLTAKQIANIYATTNNPRCTLLENVVNNSLAIVAENGTCNAWMYDLDHNYTSVTTEFNWVCENSYKAAVGQSLFFVGSCLGTIIFGLLADRFGRLPTLIISTLIGSLGDFLTAFVSSLPFFAAARFLSGISWDSQFYAMYIIAFEYLSPEKRTFGLNIVHAVFYTFGTTISPWFAIWLGDWRKYLFVASVPGLGVLLYPCFISESAHWLITKQNYPKAVQCLKRVAKYNGKQVDESVYEEFIKYYKEKAIEEELLKKTKFHKDTFWDMFRKKRMRINTIIFIVKTIIVMLGCDVVSRYMEDFGTSPLHLFSFTALAYFPGALTLVFLQNIIGRKGMVFAALLVGAIITASTGYLTALLDPANHPYLLAVMIGLGRYACSVAYDAEVQYLVEFVPTSVRGQAVSLIHVIGVGFCSLSPYIIHLGTYYKPLPLLLIAFLMMIGALLSLKLPETLNKELPETIKDGETFGANESWYFVFPCLQKPSSKNPYDRKNSCFINKVNIVENDQSKYLKNVDNNISKIKTDYLA